MNYDRLYCTVVTPFKENYEIDEVAFRKFLQYFMQPKFIDAGGAIIANPDAGEPGFLTRAEKRRLLEICMEECGGKVPVFAGAIDLRTEDTVKNSIEAKELGVDGLFIQPPIGAGDVTRSWLAEKFPEVWIDMAKEQVNATDLPAIVHPTAGSTGVLPLGPTLQMCNEIPNIIGWKMAYRYEDFRVIAKGLRTLDHRVAVLPSSGHLFQEFLATKCFDGTSTGSFNYAMEPMIDHINAWKNDDIVLANKIWFSGLYQLHDYVYTDRRHHVRYKVATWLRGFIPTPYMRPPMPRLHKEEVFKLKSLFDNLGIETISDDEIQAVVKKLSR